MASSKRPRPRTRTVFSSEFNGTLKNCGNRTIAKLYPLALDLVRTSLADLDRKQIAYRIEGFMWHQGENDMFSDKFKPAYAKNLANFIASWRRDLKRPDLRFYVGELCTKTIWGMDNRDNMYAIRTAQKAVADADPLVDYIPTSHDAVEIGGEEGLHYHYGTLLSVAETCRQQGQDVLNFLHESLTAKLNNIPAPSLLPIGS